MTIIFGQKLNFELNYESITSNNKSCCTNAMLIASKKKLI